MTSDISDFLASYSPEVRELALKTRDIIMDMQPGLKEKVYPGWRAIGYSPSGGMKDAVFAITPHTSHLNLVFFKGTELEDPNGLLKGTGKKGRHVKIKNKSDLEKKELTLRMLAALDFA